MGASQPLHPPSEALSPEPRLPGATYRVQFHAGFRFLDACRLVPYLHALGITDIYASPYLRARSGSVHGYDVADPNALNPELGTEEEYGELVAELGRHGMGQLLDVVPNHMGIGDAGNTWWLDVLENGPSSLYARFFDIDWNPLKAEIQDRDKMVLPILGDQYGLVLENGELVLAFEEGAFLLRYHDFTLPIAPDSYPHLLAFRLQHVEAALGSEHEQVLELQSILTALSHLPGRGVRDPGQMKERAREKEIAKRRIARLHQDCLPFRDALEFTLAAFNGVKGESRSFDLLDNLLTEQAYRLAFWRVAAEEINYRRFFDINELAALRTEDPEVFRQTHRLLLDLIRSGKVSGLRIDHVDGLWDPAGYLRRLQAHCCAELPAEQAGSLFRTAVLVDAPAADEQPAELLAHEPGRPGAPTPPRRMYVVVEKILGAGEGLRADWPVHGTTGYDFLNVLNGLFVERANRRAIEAAYARFTRGNVRVRDLANSSKKMVMLISLAGEVNQLAYQLRRIAARRRRHRDFTLNSLTFALREIIAALPVYRTYIDPATGAIDERDHASIEAAVADARRRNPRTDPSIFNFVRDVLLLHHPVDTSAEDRAEQLSFVARFQQTTGPVMAKGVEDTAFYVHNRLLSLNEVGGDPDQFGVSATSFHRQNAQRLRSWPHGLLATSTHDSKRSEDVRARIDVLSELPREWRAALTRWSRLNGRKKLAVDGRPAPDRNEEYLLYQTLLGAWPLEPVEGEALRRFVERIAAFMVKALREAKVNTSWINVNADYEAAVQQFVQAILDDSTPNAFLDDFHVLRRHVAHFGLFNSLAQTLLKIASPGVPDFYQGNELWDFSLVDPDNRRPVDYDTRARIVHAFQRQISREDCDLARLAQELVETREDGRIKLYVTHRGLTFRGTHPALFAHGSYLPLRGVGPRKRHLCAFGRFKDGEGVVVAAPVLCASLTRGALAPPVGEAVWGDTRLLVPGAPGERYRNQFTGEVLEASAANGKAGLPLSAVFGVFPVALLERL